MAFGWGRRVCAGQALAEQSIWISISRLLWAFRMSKAVDVNGDEIAIDIFDYTYVALLVRVKWVYRLLMGLQ